tara:strand:+ start:5039 stop:5518 length:480 start_codon:yes stop_codon:yes gene_type:complete
MPTAKQAAAVKQLLVVSVVLICFFGMLAYRSANEEHKKRNPMAQDLSLMKFLNSGIDNPSMKSILVGMSSGVVFGFIDNAGLFFGMDALDPYLPGGPLSKAGYGNTYSDALGSFLSVFIGSLIQKSTGIENTPMWSESVGIILGCLLGIHIPKMITGKK